MRVRLLLDDASEPGDFWTRFGSEPGPDTDPTSFRLLGPDDECPADYTHLFARTLDGLRAGLARSRAGMAVDGMVWASWPKKSSRLPSEIGRAEVMAEGHAAGLVDIKVCAVDEDWSGLKFVIPVADRG
jgi:hypothetical protein